MNSDNSIDKSHYDIGVFGVWYGQNYGSIATYYALHSILTSMEKSVLMIDKPIMKPDAVDAEFTSTHARRFAEKRYHISKRYLKDELSELNQLCDSFLIGSDQLWNYGISKGTGKTFYLDFVDDEKKKISLATSFGHAIDFAPEDERKKIAKYMARFDGISLREDDGVRICKEDYGINAIQVLDPVYLADPQIYTKLIQESEKGCDEPYMVSYFLDPTPEKRAALLEVSQKLGGLKIINLMDGVSSKFEKNRNALDLPDCIEDVHVEDWLKYISQAQFVMTDSFHGASFSIIFRKNFIAICNRARGFSRFQSLGRLFDVENHIVTNAKQILGNDELLKPVDYEKVIAIQQREKKKTLDWLTNLLNRPKKSKTQLIDDNLVGTVLKREGGKTAISCMNPEQCAACGACLAICPTDAISFRQDQWGYYRASVDYDRCIECGQCKSVCPALKLPKTENTTTLDCFEFISSDDAVLAHSSSGGIFTTLARAVFAKNGVVCGAAWKEDFSVHHIIIDTEDDLWKLQKSKYLQSNIEDCPRKIKKYLEEGRTVLFTGTPCQVYGLRAYLGNKVYDRLITVDMLCGNAPSSRFFQKYLQSSFGDQVKSYEFRHKSEHHRWDSIHIKAEMQDGTIITRSGPRQDDYQRVYHNHTMCAPHCENCRYQAFPRAGDLTMGDFWGIGKRDPELDTFKGVSIVLCNNQKGHDLFDHLPEDSWKVKKKVPLGWMGGNGYSRVGGKNYCSPYRDTFYREIQNRSFKEAVNFALKPNHGQYRSIYNSSDTALRIDSNMQRFHFDLQYWEELLIDGKTTLIVKDNMWRENGRYARMSLSGSLNPDRKWRFNCRFKVKSKSDILNFHVIDSGSNILQVIHSENIKGRNQGEHWIEVNTVFRPDTDYYDEFMVGASQISGPNNYLMFDYISISMEK